MTHLRIATYALLAGCVAELPETDVSSQQVTTSNGISLNGISLNGISLNGISLNGISLNGISLNGISLNGISLNGTSLDGASLDTAVFEGSTWVGLLSNGLPLELRIDAATTGTGANADVGFYAVSYAADGVWKPLCPGDAIAVPGTWNQHLGTPGGGAYTASDTQFTFACRGTSVAKCVELGYKPWHGHAARLASCVRMLRGDYCGDGTPFTIDGQRLNVYDDAGVQLDTQAWTAEAEWGPDGARCVTTANQTRFTQTGRAIPPCFGQTVRATRSCGRGFSPGTLLISELASTVDGGFTRMMNDRYNF